MKVLQSFRSGGVDWVSIFSLLIIALALLGVLKTFSGSDAAGSDFTVVAPRDRGVPDSAGGAAQLDQSRGAGLAQHPRDAHKENSGEPGALEMKSVDLLGVSVQLREMRTETEDGGAGEIRNIEFFIREGIRPRRLFDDASQLVTGHWPLFHNNVGYGATTVRILYQLVDTDTDGDGVLTKADRKSLAFSLPDGSRYRVLDRDVDEISNMNYLSESNELHLDISVGGELQRRVYSLATGSR